jgi:hypothetical protein
VTIEPVTTSAVAHDVVDGTKLVVGATDGSVEEWVPAVRSRLAGKISRTRCWRTDSDSSRADPYGCGVLVYTTRTGLRACAAVRRTNHRFACAPRLT